MINGQNPLDLIPLNELDDERSGGRVVSSIASWCKDRSGEAQGGRALKKLAPDDWFQLHIKYKRFRIASDGDHLMGIPFGCALCQLRNVN